MIGSFIGDIVGSIYEFSNIKTKCFPFYGPTEAHSSSPTIRY